MKKFIDVSSSVSPVRISDWLKQSLTWLPDAPFKERERMLNLLLELYNDDQREFGDRDKRVWNACWMLVDGNTDHCWP